MNRYKRPESVLVVIYTTAGDVLLLERRHPAGYWQSVTGSLKWGEDAPTAAVREVAEETGLDVGDRLIDSGITHRFDIIPPWQARYAPGVLHNTEYVFQIAYDARPAIRINPDEHSRYRWLAREAAMRCVSSATNREAIATFMLLQ